MRREPGTFSPPSRVSDPDMHHGTCVMHVPWCMSGSLTNGDRTPIICGTIALVWPPMGLVLPAGQWVVTHPLGRAMHSNLNKVASNSRGSIASVIWRPLTTLKKIGSHIYDKQSAANGFMILTVRPCIDIYVGTRWAIIPLEFICLKILFNQSYFLTVIRSGVVQFFTLVHRKMGAMGWSDFLRFWFWNRFRTDWFV